MTGPGFSVLDVLNRFKRAVADRYVIEREIGRGGMAIVFLAQDVRYGRQVAVKLLRPELTACLGAERFLREIEIAARLSHPNIVPVFDSGQAADLLYYVMPFIDGESLRVRLHRGPPLTLEEGLGVVRDVGMALRYAHGQDVIHRDIKPENILLTSGPAVVADFGIARAITEAGGGDITGSGFPMGTMGYMSPEQAAGSRSLDPRTDVYSLGCVLYEIVCGTPPGRWLTHEEVATGRLQCARDGERERLSAAPTEIETILVRTLAQERDERFQSIDELLVALGAPSAILTPPQRPPAHRSPRVRISPRGLLGVAAVLIALVSAALFVRSRSGPVPDPNVLAVAPFDVLGEGLGPWREGFVDLLSTSLDGAGPIRTIPPSVTIRRWHGRAENIAAAHFGEDVGAGLVVFGRLVGAGADSVRAAVTLLDVMTGGRIAEIELREETNRIDRLADSIAVRLMEQLSQQRTLGAWRLSSLGSSSPQAVRLFLQGEQHWRRFDLDSARQYFERAIAIDSGFALAHNHLANSLGWDLREVGDMVPGMLRAGELNHGLARRESLLLVSDSIWGALGTFAGDPEGWGLSRRHLRTLELAAREYPLDPQIWYQLGEGRFHNGPSVGVPFFDALAAFERAVELDSPFVPSYRHLVQLHLTNGNVEAARTTAGQYSLLRSLSPDALYQVWYDVKWWPDAEETAVRVARVWAETPDSLSGQFTLAFGWAFRGHLMDVAAMQILPQIPEMVAQLVRLGALTADSAVAIFDKWRDVEQGYGILAALPWWHESGDSVALLSALAAWDSGTAVGRAGPDAAARYWRPVTAAYLDLLRGDTARALAALDGLPSWPCRTCYYPHLARARILAAQGRLSDAVVAYERLEFPLDRAPLPDMVVVALERGRLYEQLDRREHAVEAYSFVIDSWRQPDDALLPMVQEARDALARLAGEPRR
jgi:serine/threonine-protein kinase